MCRTLLGHGLQFLIYLLQEMTQSGSLHELHTSQLCDDKEGTFNICGSLQPLHLLHESTLTPNRK